MRGCCFLMRGVWDSSQLLFGLGPRIGVYHVPAITVLSHPEPHPQSQGQCPGQGKQLLVQGCGAKHHQQGQGRPPLRVPISGPAVASIPATLRSVAAFLTVSIVEVIMTKLVIGWTGDGREGGSEPQRNRAPFFIPERIPDLPQSPGYSLMGHPEKWA